MITSAPYTDAPQASPGRVPASPRSTAGGYRWRVVDDPPPPAQPTRFQRLFAWLYEFNRY